MAWTIVAAAGINYGAGIISWLIIGVLAGYVASRVTGAGGYGLGGDLLVGIVGAVIGGFLLSLFNLGANTFLETLITAIVGACLLIALVHAVTGQRTRTP